MKPSGKDLGAMLGEGSVQKPCKNYCFFNIYALGDGIGLGRRVGLTWAVLEAPEELSWGPKGAPGPPLGAS